MVLRRSIALDFNDQYALHNFDGFAQYLVDNTAYLPADVLYLRKLFNKGMEAASSEATKEQFVHTLAGVIEHLAAVDGHGSMRGTGALAERYDIGALRILSKALFRHADASMAPPDFARNLEQTALELQRIAKSRPDLPSGLNIKIATRVLNKKAKLLVSIAEKTDKLQSVPATAVTPAKRLTGRTPGLNK